MRKTMEARNSNIQEKSKAIEMAALKDATVDIAAEDKDGDMALSIAVMKRDEAAAERLVTQGVDVHHKNLSGQTALHRAAWEGLTKTIQTLVDTGCDVNCRDLLHLTPLMYSCLFDQRDAVRMLINLGADLKAEDCYGDTALTYAAFKSHVEVVDELLRAKADVRHENKQGKTALLHASNIDIVDKLVRYRADVNHRDKCGKTLLYRACDDGLEDIVKYLLSPKVRASPNIACFDGTTPLIGASYVGNVDIVRTLLMNGADDTLVNNHGQTARDIAELKGYTEVLALLERKNPTPGCVLMKEQLMRKRLLLDAIERNDNIFLKEFLNGIDVNVRYGSKGETPLIYCASSGNFEGVAKLLDSGADVNMSDVAGYTPLMEAAKTGNVHIVRALMSAGADVNLKTADLNTALTIAAGRGDDEMLDIFLGKASKPCIDAQNRYGMNALMFAARARHVSTVKRLLAKSADVSLRSGAGKTALQVSLESRDMRTAKKIVRAEFSQDAQSPVGKTTTLHYLAMQGRTETTRRLLSFKLNVNVTDKRGMTPLMYCSIYGNIDMLCLLLKKKAQINISGDDGRTALHLAVIQRNLTIVEILVKSGAKTDMRDNKKLTPADHVGGHAGMLKALSPKSKK